MTDILSAILARLKDQLTGFRHVGNAADLEAITNGVVPAPSAYLIPVSEQADDNPIAGGFVQRLNITFGIVIVVQNRRDAVGAAAAGDLFTARSAVMQALLSYVPDSNTGDTVSFSGGRLLQFEDGLLWWGDEYRVQSVLLPS